MSDMGPRTPAEKRDVEVRPEWSANSPRAFEYPSRNPIDVHSDFAEHCSVDELIKEIEDGLFGAEGMHSPAPTTSDREGNPGAESTGGIEHDQDQRCGASQNHKKSEHDAASPAEEFVKKSESTMAKDLPREKKKARKSRASSPRPAARGKPPIVSRKPPAQKPWERLEDEDRALIYQLALDELGDSHPFTVNITHSLVLKAKSSKKKVSTWFNERMAQYLEPLEKKLGHKVPYWFVIEISRTGVLHLHGAIGVNDNFLTDVRRALAKVSGMSTTGAHHYFVRVKDFDERKHFNGRYGSHGWAAYSTKQCKRTSGLGLGAPLVCRRDLNRAARKEFSELISELRRKEVLELIRESELLSESESLGTLGRGGTSPTAMWAGQEVMKQGNYGVGIARRSIVEGSKGEMPVD